MVAFMLSGMFVAVPQDNEVASLFPAAA